MQKNKCTKCGKEISLSNYSKHINSCNGENKKKIQIQEEWLQPNGKYKCPNCEKEYSKNGMCIHMWRSHTEDGKNFDPNKGFKDGTRKGWNKGLTKETSDSVKKIYETRKQKYDSGEYIYSFTGKKHTEETKEKIRKARIEYLNLKTGNTAWEKVQRGELTYLEQKFYNEINKYNLFEKYDIVYNYCEYPYFLDFAFININFVVELDGACHFNNGNERIQHDIDRDKYLNEKHWKIFRIAYNDNWEDKINELFNILNNIENYKSKSLEDRLYIRSEYKQNNNKEIKLEKQKLKQQFIENRINLIINSNIDFSKFGWVGKVAEIINISPQKVSIWMKKYMLEFYEEKCFKKKNNC